MSADPHPDRLEARYRRLLALYPAEHRARYGAEMIDVLMASARPGQRRPDLREALDLVASGLRTRLGSGAGGGMSPASRSAARVFGFLASVALAALSGYQVSVGIAWRGVFDGPRWQGWLAEPPYQSLAMAVGWALVAGACMAGLRRVAAVGALLGLLGEAVVTARYYDVAPDTFIASWWQLTLTAFTAACLIVPVGAAPGGWRGVLRRDSGGVRPLGPRAVLVLGVAALLAVAEPFVDRASAVVETGAHGTWLVRSRLPTVPLPGFFGMPGRRRLAALILVVALAVVVLRLRPAVRRRVVVLAAPSVAVVLLVQFGFQGFQASSPRFWPPVYLTAGQWAALVLVPLLVFAGGTWLLRRYERQLASGALLA